MKKVFFVVNDVGDFSFKEEADKYLPGVDVSAGVNLPANRGVYDLIVLWSYRKIIPDLSPNVNVMVFHSSDLPEGKGWAPIFHTVYEKQPFYTITGILASDAVDSGDIVVKAKFRMKPQYTAEILRKWDSEITLRLIGMILHRFPDSNIVGTKQTGKGSYYKKRQPEDNEVPLDARLSDILQLLLASEPGHPVFVNYGGVRFNLFLSPAVIPDFPDDLEVIF